MTTTYPPAQPVQKRCTKCGEEKPLTEYHRDRSSLSGLVACCRPCVAEKSRAWRLANPEREAEKLRVWRLANPERVAANKRASQLRRYGLTPEQFDTMLAAQGGRCAACGTDDPGKGQPQFHIDHDHECCPYGKGCGKCTRGLLCGPCNMTLGRVEDDPGRLLALAAYALRTRNVLGEVSRL